MNIGTPTRETDFSTLTIEHIQNPNRLWAIPVIGGAVKLVIVIPVSIWLLLVDFAAIFLSIINAFVVLLAGRYWQPAYALAVGSMRLTAKANCFYLGLSDTYPGFSLESSDDVRLEFAMPTQPNRLLALPLIGGIFRFAILVPFFIYLFIIGILVVLVFWFAWIPVLLLGRYPEGLFSLMVYAQRLQLKLSAYMFGLTDRYPLFDDGLGPDEWGPGRHDRVYRPLGPETFR